MPFQVFEQGRGIATPWYDIFPPRQVTRLRATAATAPLSAHESEEREAPTSDSHKRRTPARAFEAVDAATRERQPVHTAGQIMSQPVDSVLPSLDLAGLWRRFTETRYRHLPVVDAQGQLLGIVSDRDLLQASSRLASGAGWTGTARTVADIMKRRVLTAAPDTNLRELAAVMIQHRIGAMPLMSAGALVGIVTRTDILRTLSHQVPVDLWS